MPISGWLMIGCVQLLSRPFQDVRTCSPSTGRTWIGSFA